MPFIDLVDGTAAPLVVRASLAALHYPLTSLQCRTCVLQLDDPTTIGATVVYVGNQQPFGASSAVSASNYDAKLSISKPEVVIGKYAETLEIDLSLIWLLAVGGNVRVLYDPEVSGGEG